MLLESFLFPSCKKLKQIQKFKPAVSLPRIQRWSWSPWRCSRGCTSQGRWTPPSKWPGKAKDDIWWKWQTSFVKVVASFQVIRFPATYLVATFMSGNLTNIQDFWEGQGWDLVKVILWKWKWSPPTKWPRKIKGDILLNFKSSWSQKSKSIEFFWSLSGILQEGNVNYLAKVVQQTKYFAKL